MGNYLSDIWDLSLQLAIKFVHVPREQNVMTDKLANLGVWGIFIIYKE